MSPKQPPSPWIEFLTELDALLPEPFEIHCLGGFVVSMLYGMPRPTADVDYLSAIPSDQNALLLELGGRGSALHRRYGVYLQFVGVATVPDNYSSRLTPMFPLLWERLRLLGLEAHDLALSKLERNLGRDRDDLKYLAQSGHIDPAVLESRYHAELRPYLANVSRHDLTLSLWLDIIRHIAG